MKIIITVCFTLFFTDLTCQSYLELKSDNLFLPNNTLYDKRNSYRFGIGFKQEVNRIGYKLSVENIIQRWQDDCVYKLLPNETLPAWAGIPIAQPSFFLDPPECTHSAKTGNNSYFITLQVDYKIYERDKFSLLPIVGISSIFRRLAFSEVKAIDPSRMDELIYRSRKTDIIFAKIIFIGAHLDYQILENIRIGLNFQNESDRISKVNYFTIGFLLSYKL